MQRGAIPEHPSTTASGGDFSRPDTFSIALPLHGGAGFPRLVLRVTCAAVFTLACLLPSCIALPPRRSASPPAADPSLAIFQRAGVLSRYHQVTVAFPSQHELTRAYLCAKGRGCIFYGACLVAVGLGIALGIQQKLGQQCGAAIAFIGFGSLGVGIFLTTMGEWWTWISYAAAVIIATIAVVIFSDTGLDAWWKRWRSGAPKPPRRSAGDIVASLFPKQGSK